MPNRNFRAGRGRTTGPSGLPRPLPAHVAARRPAVPARPRRSGRAQGQNRRRLHRIVHRLPSRYASFPGISAVFRVPHRLRAGKSLAQGLSTGTFSLGELLPPSPPSCRAQRLPSCTSIWTPFTRPSSNATGPSSADGLSSSEGLAVKAWSAPLPTKPGRSAFTAPCRWPQPGDSVRRLCTYPPVWAITRKSAGRSGRSSSSLRPSRTAQPGRGLPGRARLRGSVRPGPGGRPPDQGPGSGVLEGCDPTTVIGKGPRFLRVANSMVSSQHSASVGHSFNGLRSLEVFRSCEDTATAALPARAIRACRQGQFNHSIRLGSFQLPPRDFKQTSGARWYRLASMTGCPANRLKGSAPPSSAMASSISSSHSAGVRGSGRFI